MKLNAYQRGNRDGLINLVERLYKMYVKLNNKYDKDKQKLDSGPFKDSHMHKRTLERDLERIDVTMKIMVLARKLSRAIPEDPEETND